MKITILGNQTVHSEKHSRERTKKFEDCLKRNWSAVQEFKTTSNSNGEICLYVTKIKDLTVKQVLLLLKNAVEEASKECNWHIWRLPYYEI